MNLRKSVLGYFALVLMLGGSALSAGASAPMSANGNPGYYRFKVGSFEVTALSDGSFDLPISKLLTNVTPDELKKDLKKSFLSEPVETSVNAFLINTGTKLVLIDTGVGKAMGPTVGKLPASLKAAGYTPEQVDAVLITHMHPDHIGGLVSDGKLVFPNATIYAGKPDADFWISQANMDKAKDADKGRFKAAMGAFNPYTQAGKTNFLTTDIEVVPGIHSHASHGHTPGHTSYVVESGDQKLVLMGDLVHVAAVQFEKPSARMAFDWDQKSAEKERVEAFAAAAKGGYLVAAAHLPFPGVGHIRSERKEFAFVPLNYNR